MCPLFSLVAELRHVTLHRSYWDAEAPDTCLFRIAAKLSWGGVVSRIGKGRRVVLITVLT